MTAARRAARLITKASGSAGGWKKLTPRAIVAALMADPDLLVDLAIAAGAWERYAMCAECGEWVNPEPGHSCPRCDTVTDVSIPVAIARRTTQENDRP